MHTPNCYLFEKSNEKLFFLDKYYELRYNTKRIYLNIIIHVSSKEGIILKDDQKSKKYNKPSRKINGIAIAYLASVSTLVAAMTLILLVYTKAKDNVTDNITSYYSEQQSDNYRQTVDNWFESKVPESNPIAPAITPPHNNYPPNGAVPPPHDNPASDNSVFSSGFPTAPDKSTASMPTNSSPSDYSEVSHPTEYPTQSAQSENTPSSSAASSNIAEPVVIPAETNDKVVYDKNGNVIIGTRALSLYSADTSNCAYYANVINKYKSALPNANVYCMTIPTACEFYSTSEIAARCTSQLAHINEIYRNLSGVTPVNAYSELQQHTDEAIYLRTDHHWAPLGGYYAAKAFANAAGVPFLPLTAYAKHTNTGFVGTMYGYTEKNSVLKNNPEDFVYYTPNNVDYVTTYYNYKLSGGTVTGAYEPMKAAFFLNYGNNASDNYCTFMGGDAKIVHVKTNTKNGRRLAIFKDSFGNTIPGYLFGSFEEIYVLDLRYFSHNAVDFMKEKNITDLLFANNTTVTAGSSMTAKLEKLLTQEDMGF